MFLKMFLKMSWTLQVANVAVPVSLDAIKAHFLSTLEIHTTLGLPRMWPA